MPNTSLADLFETHFEVVPAVQSHMLEKVFRIRHQVYCEELGFEPNRVNQLEQDEFDNNSIHCLLLHKPTQTYVGCVRLVLADTQAPESELGFPFEQVCGKAVRWAFDASAGTGRKQYGEISRLAITANFRRPRNGVPQLDGTHPKLDAREEEARRLFPSIAVGLYLAVAAMGLSKGLDGVFAMMEPRLARQLSRFGIQCQPAGEAVEHRGIRVPYFISRHSLLDNLRLECKTLLSKIQCCLALPYAPYA
ncbi:MAG: PEP-CTERM/exosortase system-associated acyltransferase [Comamonadaceae bacterium CG_4_9_14_3_um_filter_60_33]|nr:MAG: PEP-CTERM/exosortase system-associated acyltransferase [Comamonadaceae bacterium CG_4_10_14_3_um_filter_60_42]PJB46548.1 MAG: PEP-CTERM/exosortase system-associated acyltransferase [Comamonadaceae bacterium CG_4_9_14_3_um_filter_60_33]